MNRLLLRSSVELLLAFFLFYFSATSAQAVTTEVIYQSDFASDPLWTTDQPENFFWDETEEALFARTYNRPNPNYSPSRHYYVETDLIPKLSYELTWDMKILNVEGGGGSGVAVFGLYGDRLYGFNPLNLNFVGNSQDGTFSFRLMTLEGYSRFIFTEVNPGYNGDIGEQAEYPFELSTWYTMTLTFDASTKTYHFEMKDRDSDTLLFTRNIVDTINVSINPELQNLGISMHPEGTGATNLALTSRIDGFTEYLIDNVTLTQIYDETYTAPPSVLFLPGIQASRLYTDGALGTENQLWEPNIDADVAKLEMTDTGESVNNIYTRDIMDAIHGFSDVYGSFTEHLDTLVSDGVISDWESYAYDWRYSVNDVVTNGTQYENEVRELVATVEQLARTNNSHVTIVAHSNGGLLAKTLVARLETEGMAHLIDKLILVASPQVGTPKAVGAILHGYDQERGFGFIIDDETARSVIRNFPGVYGLLPSDAFFTNISEPMIRFKSSASPPTTPQVGQTLILNNTPSDS